MTLHVRRLLTAALLPIALGGALAGCGDSSDDTASTPPAGGASGQSSGAAAAPEEGAGDTSHDMEGMDHGADGAGASGGGASATPAAKPSNTASSSVDAAFVRQMIPHHEMAIDMAGTARRHAEHPELKRLAVSIIRTQRVEVKTLEGVGERLKIKTDASASESSMSADAKALGVDMGDMGMDVDTGGKLASADPFDPAFIDEMTAHHQGAILMARTELAKGRNAQLKRLAAGIIAEQTKELAQMSAWKASWT